MSPAENDSEFVLRLLDETREEITRADSKASILLGAASVACAVLLTSLMSGDVRIERLPNSIEWLCWLGVFLVVAGMALLVRAVLPTSNSGQSGRVDYYKDFARYATADKLAKALKVTHGSRHDRHVRQLHVASRLADRKYRSIRRGNLFLSAGIVALLGASLVDYWR